MTQNFVKDFSTATYDEDGVIFEQRERVFHRDIQTRDK